MIDECGWYRTAEETPSLVTAIYGELAIGIVWYGDDSLDVGIWALNGEWASFPRDASCIVRGWLPSDGPTPNIEGLKLYSP